MFWAGSSAVFFREVGKRFGISREAFAANDLLGVEGDVALFAEFLARADVGEVHLDGGQPHGFQGV